MSVDLKTLGAAIQTTGTAMTEVGSKLQGPSPNVEALAKELTDTAQALTNALPKAEDEVAGIPTAVKADGADADANEDVDAEEEKAAEVKRKAAAVAEEPVDAPAKEDETMTGNLFDGKGGKKKKKRGGKSQRVWKKKGGRQTKKRRNMRR